MSDLIERCENHGWHEDDAPLVWEMRDEIERLRAELCTASNTIGMQSTQLKQANAVIERNGKAIAMYSQSLGTVDRVNFERGIEKAIAEIERLIGDLNIMRLQRDATHASRCSNCDRLRAALERIVDVPLYLQSRRDKYSDKAHKMYNIASEALKDE